MYITFNLWPGGKTRALTMSYDDGQHFDMRLADIFDAHGIRGTFHLNSRHYVEGDEDDIYLKPDEVRSLAARHEISLHMHTHPFPTQIPPALAAQETQLNKQLLEGMAGYPIRGMSYPYGDYSDDVITLLRALGMEYSRTTLSTGGFDVPGDFMKWHPTCHHTGAQGKSALELFDSFLNDHYVHVPRKPRLFYLWGHSFEFDREDNWNLIEDFCRVAGGHDDIWYATNIEIVDYINAVRSLKFSQDMTMVRNISPLDVYISVDKKPVCLRANALTHLK